ncbi:MAG: homoserine dehydrogenase [Deltaproteobacteria bacterium]|nr:homoserine dehydrogenase [Deltaproteobacteria bacterium]
MRNVRVGLIGFGTIGSGVVKIFQDYGADIAEKVGINLVLKKIADLDIVSPRTAFVPQEMLTTDAREIVSDPEINIVIELMGGIEPARSLILQAINNKKHIVTANKALLAIDGDLIFRAAQECSVDIGFEASVAGTIPVIKTLREALVANRIESLLGIINGTSNYILSKMTDEHLDFATALKQAQAKGYAEADPSFDVNGTDAKHKLAILLSIAYGKKVNIDAIYCEGITKITPEDIKFAAELGYRVKLLAIAIRREGRVEARLHPTLVPANHPIARVENNYNALHIVGSSANAVFLHGEGAGMMPTASAVMSDVIDIARNISCGISGRVPSRHPDERNLAELAIVPMEDVATNYYIRFMALDRPGVLSKISGIFAKYAISIASVIQKGRMQDGSAVPLVMLTHSSRERAVCEALLEIRNLDVIAGEPMLIRIEERD